MPDVNVNGIKIHYDICGAGEPLILLMGLGAPGSRWEDHAAAYEQHVQCVVVDNRGAGGSDKPAGPYSTAMMADDTAGLIAALGIERAHVAGISMGSAIAQELALRHPEKVRSLVLVSSWSRCDRYTRAVFEHMAAVRAVTTPAVFTQLLQLWIFTAGHYEANFADMLQGQAEAEADYMTLPAFEAQCAACCAHDTYARLGGIAAPTLLTVGDADIFTPLRLSREMHEAMPGSELLVLPGLGHAHHWEDLAQFNARTTAFLLAH